MSRSVAVVGAGAVGLGTAWLLAEQGHDVLVVDPRLNQRIERVDRGSGLTGTSASLGVLMGHVFRRSSGRGWRMRQRSMALWPQWIQALKAWEPALTLHQGLVQVAEDADAFARMTALADQRQNLGLKALAPDELSAIWPEASHGGLLSCHDGRLDPLLLQIALRAALAAGSATCLAEPVTELNRRDNGWMLSAAGGHQSHHDAVVLCTALASAELLEPLGHSRPMTPVLGQALRLRLADSSSDWPSWPAVLVDQGFNLIPDGSGQLWLGATVEPGDRASDHPLALMRSLNERAPTWLRTATVIEQWTGLRARPVDRPAPLLETLEPGLILATGHYRNGVLLTPATAECVANSIADP
ncbi:MAG: NAD(P)/FAD-dependent oxidoreductase [Synechococcus sp.]